MLMLLSSAEEEQQPRDSEMKTYFKDTTKSSTGPQEMEWWQKNEERYPKRSRATKRFLSIPSTSTPSERIFSKPGFIISKTRSALLPANVNKLVFLVHNLKRLNRAQAEDWILFDRVGYKCFQTFQPFLIFIGCEHVQLKKKKKMPV